MMVTKVILGFAGGVLLSAYMFRFYVNELRRVSRIPGIKQQNVRYGLAAVYFMVYYTLTTLLVKLCFYAKDFSVEWIWKQPVDDFIDVSAFLGTLAVFGFYEYASRAIKKKN